MSVNAQYWHEYPGATAFEDAARAAYRALAAPLLARAAVPWDWRASDAERALMACLIDGRAFCFLPSVDTLDRVRMRDEWQVLRAAIRHSSDVNCHSGDALRHSGDENGQWA
jgi:hypothetical protein